MRHVEAAQDRKKGRDGAAAPEYISETDLKMSFERQLEGGGTERGRRELLGEDGQIDYSDANFDDVVKEILNNVV